MSVSGNKDGTNEDLRESTPHATRCLEGSGVSLMLWV